jgi:hypothetical protein
MMAVLGLGIYTLTTSSSFGEILAGNDIEAYQLAKAGMRFAVNQLNINSNYTGGTYLMPDANNTFTVSVANNVITVTGTTKQGLLNFMAANRTLAYNYSWAANAGTVSFAGNMPGFTNPNNGQSESSGNASKAIVASTATNTVALGGNVTDSYGTLLFKGSSNNGNCVNGSCNFSNGIRAFFNFTFATQDTSSNSTSGADGFTFAVISAITNTSDRTGGAPSGYSMGELMGYGGPGNTSDGLGLTPPKIALTFDTYPNGTNGSPNNVCQSGSRNDPSSFYNNVTFMYWGSNPSSTTMCTGSNTSYPIASFDDNEHGAGQNPSGVDYPSSRLTRTCKSGSGTCNFMEDGYTYSARIEIMPTATPYTYSLKAWIVLQDDPSIFTTTTWWSDFQNPILPYTDTTPQISKTVTFTSSDYNNFQKVFFGFTEATGAATQLATLDSLNVYFPTSSTGHGSQTITPNPITFTPTTLAVGGTATASTETSSSGLPVTLSSLTPSICSVSGSTVTAISVGTCTIAANQAGDAYYYPAPQVTGNITVGVASQTIGTITFSPTTLTVGGTTTASATATSGLPVTFTSLTTSICTVSGTNGSTVTGVAVGTCNIAANQAGNANYSAAPQVTKTITVGKGSQTITLNAGTPLTYGNSETISATGGSGTGTVTYSLTSGSCTLSGTTLTATSGTGTCSVTATKAADANYNSATATATVTLSPANQAITLNAGTPLTYNTSETLSTTGGSGTGAVTYSTTSGCSVSGATLTATSGTGSCTVTATKAADGNYNSATATATVTLNMANQATLTVNAGTPLTYGNSETLSISGGSGTGVVTYYLLAGGCTLSGTTLTATSGSGTCVVYATKAADANYNLTTSANKTVNLQPASQTIGTITFNPTTLTIGGTTTASATATSGLAVTFTSQTTSICTVSGTNGSTVTAVAAGTCTIAANQAGNTNYNAAPQVTGSIPVNKLSQTIGAITFNPTTLNVGGTTTASATATSGLAVTFTSTTTSICTVSGTNGSTVTAIAAGTCTIAANQAGNANYNAATQVTQNITVGKGNQTIGAITFNPTTLTVGGTTTASATASSGLAVTFTSLTTGVCTASGTNGSTITGVTSGTCTIAANQAGNANYNAATQVTQNITVTCPGYRVWNHTSASYDFQVTGQSCRTNVGNNTEITTSTVSTQLGSGETVSRYTRFSNCGTYQGQITYPSAVTADTNGNCQVNYNSGDTAGDR